MIGGENTLRNLLWENYESVEIQVFTLLIERWERVKSSENPNIQVFWIAPSLLKIFLFQFQLSRFMIPKSVDLLPFRAGSNNTLQSNIDGYLNLRDNNHTFCEFSSSDRTFLFLNLENRFYEKVKSRSWYRCGWC